MAMLINDNETLRKYVHNTLKAVAGELSLFDKIQYHLLQAEQWLTDTFVSSDTMSRIRTYSDSTPLLHYCRIITAAEAMLHAVPQLDLILAPNGVLQSGAHGHTSHGQRSQQVGYDSRHRPIQADVSAHLCHRVLHPPYRWIPDTKHHRHREQHTFSQGQPIRWMKTVWHRQTLWRPWI